ncbi:MAG: YdcF family protein [Eubacterium sp.]|nr:YdcF family protein [Eubacterium sp.]
MIIRIIVIVLGFICEILYTPPLFLYGIVNIGNATGIAIGVILILYGIFAFAINPLIKKIWKVTVGRVIVSVIAAIIILAIAAAVILSALIIHEATSSATGDETLVVLGCQVRGSSPSLMLRERLTAAQAYLDEHEDAVCILSGGQGSDEDISEAQCMYTYLTEHGVDPDRLIMEDKSTSTRENLRFSLEIIQERGLSTNLAIVTNEFHEYRASVIADKLNIETTAVSAHTHWWMFSTYFTREWYGIVYEWIA